jgi:membrane-bound serine protease (ClpP class)
MNRLLIFSRWPRWAILALMFACLAPAGQAETLVHVLPIKEAIGPATTDFIERGLEQARQEQAALVVLQMDTPGGLDSAMREIIQLIMASPVPVVSYVSPSGARAASAGTYILYASHVAAMAPGTNLGAATPVQIGGLPGLGDQDEKKPEKNQEAEKDPEHTEDSPGEGDTMQRKLINDAAAYLRSLAQMHGRNEEWAQQAVRESASLSAQEALDKRVIDLIAGDLPELLERLHGREVTVLGQKRVLHTQGATLKESVPDWRNRLLAVLSNPNMAYILLLLGIYGLFFELYNPGSVFPGVLGGICLLLAMFAFQILPVNYAGLALILLGLAFMIAEAFLPSFGILGIGGVIAFIVGSIILLDTHSPYYAISRGLIVGLALFSVGFFLLILNMLTRIRERPVVSGKEHLLGAEGKCLSSEREGLQVLIQGERWNARSAGQILPGQPVRVTGIEGLVLEVKGL